MAFWNVKDFSTSLAVKIKTLVVNTDENIPAHAILDSTGAEVIGTKVDAKNAATDATAVSLVSLLKQISASVQAAATALGGSLTVATHAVTGSGNFASTVADGANVALGAKADAKNPATDATPISVMAVLKQISASVQAAITSATAAGENHIGEVGGNSAVVGATFNRPANTTAYASGQLVANDTVVGNLAPMQIAAARVNDKTGLIRRGRLTKSGTSTANAIFRAHLYKTSPTAANGDGGAFQTNNALTYIGSMDFDMSSTNARAFSDGVKCIATPNVGSEIIFDPATGTQNIFALLEARGAYAPVSGETFTLALEVMRD